MVVDSTHKYLRQSSAYHLVEGAGETKVLHGDKRVGDMASKQPTITL